MALRLADGYLPIVAVNYSDGDAKYRQETFVMLNGSLADHGVAFVRFSLTAISRDRSPRD